MPGIEKLLWTWEAKSLSTRDMHYLMQLSDLILQDAIEGSSQSDVQGKMRVAIPMDDFKLEMEETEGLIVSPPVDTNQTHRSGNRAVGNR